MPHRKYLNEIYLQIQVMNHIQKKNLEQCQLHNSWTELQSRGVKGPPQTTSEPYSEALNRAQTASGRLGPP